MARHLIEAGHTVAVWSHNRGKTRMFAEQNGAVYCEHPSDVSQGAECAFLCVGNTEMARSTILGNRGLASNASAGLVIADCSTISPTESVRMASELKARRVEFLDAPCTGSKAGAEAGTLTFMIGGDRPVFDRVRPYFEAMGKLLYYCGGHGMGLRAKLAQNLILGNLLQAFNEGMVLSVKAGVDADLMLDILNNSAARSVFISAKAPAAIRRDFSTHFSVKWMEKDMGLMLDLAGEIGVPLPLTALSQQMLRAAIAKGYGDDDICGSIRVLEELAECQVGPRAAPVET